MAVHKLKILPIYYKSVISGEKTFELRKNDRDYKVGDVLELEEWSAETSYTGRKISAAVTYVLANAAEYGLEDGYCILGIKIDSVEKWKQIYTDGDIVMSELLAYHQPKQELTADEMRELIKWAGDDEFCYVTDDKEIWFK